MKNNIIKVIASLFAIVLLLSACGSGTNTAKGTLRLAATAAPNSLNNLTTSEAANFDVLNNVFEGLTRMNIKGEIEPAVAESWTISDDKTVYTFKLRDTKWSNGEPVTAADFVFGWQKVLTLDTSSYKSLALLLKNGEAVTTETLDLSQFGVEAIDDHTLKMTLETPKPYILDVLSMITFAPVNEAFYNEVTEDQYGTSKETILSNGAYELSEYQAEAGYTLQKRADYWDAKNVSMETVNVRIVSSLDTQSVMFDNNELDKLELVDTLIDKYADRDGIEVQTENRVQKFYLSGTTGTPNELLANKNFRAAVAHSIDKQLIAETILKDGSIGVDFWIPKGFVQLDGKDYREASGEFNEPYFSVEKANEYLAAAKQELGDVSLSFVLNSVDSEPQKKVFQNVVAQIQENLPGVTVQLETKPRQTYFTTLFEFKTPAAYSGWGADFADPISFFAMFESDSGLNFPQYNNPAYDAAIAKAESAEMGQNPEKRWETFFEAERILLNDFVAIPVYQKGAKIITQNGIQNFTYKTGQPVRHFRLVTQK